MEGKGRLIHIDGLRGLAVLLMILVHAAATWEPELTGLWMGLGVVVSAAGGLAAPLFITLLGWGMAQKQLTAKKRLWRAASLFFCQLIVNMSAPHLFEPWTPGVLSLMGTLILLEPCWRNVQHRGNPLGRTFFLAFSIVCCLTLLFGDWQGPSAWSFRVSTGSASVLVHHLFFTGLYPVFPWVVFAWLGATIASLQVEEERHGWLRTTSLVGLVISALVLAQSIQAGRPWALPTGDAALTFFPANAPFLVAALTGVSLLWWAVERFSMVHRVADLGRVSLTVYVLHFLPFALFHASDEVNHWSPALTAFVVVAYTTIWALAGTWWHRRCSSYTLEAWMRRFEPATSRAAK